MDSVMEEVLDVPEAEEEMAPSFDYKKLRSAMKSSYDDLKTFRDQYTERITHYAGDYGDTGLEQKLPINMVRMAVDIWSRDLAAKNPSVLALTNNLALRGQAEDLELALDHLLREIKFSLAVEECVKGALFQMGIMKVGITDQAMNDVAGVWADGGQPYARPVLFSDFVWDMDAKRQDEWTFCGNRYTMALDDVVNNPAFENTDQLQPQERAGDQFGDSEDRPEDISRGSRWNKDAYRDVVDLWDIWLPRENLLVTLAANDNGPPLRVMEWSGPEGGPFHVLAFGCVPGNTVPAGMVGHIFDNHTLLNSLMVKLGEQADRQKTVGFAPPQAGQDGSSSGVLECEDGQILVTNGTQPVKEVRLGGADQTNLSFAIWLKGIISYTAGNLDVLAGLSQQADTATQEKLLAGSSSAMIGAMQTTTEMFVIGIIEALGQHLWTDPFIELPLVKRTPGGRMEIPFTWTAEDREGDFYQYNIRIQPYSMQSRSPQQRMQMLDQTVKDFIIPAAQAGMLDQNNLQFDITEYLKLKAKLGDMPELNRIMKSGAGPLLDAPRISASGGIAPRMAPETTRNYTRTSVSTGGTQQSQDQVLMQSLMGGQPNQDQMAQQAKPPVGM